LEWRNGENIKRRIKLNILITGIYGFLGSHLANHLAKSHSVCGIYNSSTTTNLDASISVFREVNQLPFVPDVMVMCHAAVVSGTVQLDSSVLFQSNVAITEAMMKQFPNARTIYVSSVSVLGTIHQKNNETSPEHPESEYAISKYWGEKVVLKNKNNSVVRFSSLYGERMKENTLLPNYCNQSLQKNKIQVWGNGARLQNYIHVSDAVLLIEKMIQSESNIEFPILGVSNKEYSNLEVAQTIAKLTNCQIEFVGEDNSKSFTYDNSMTQTLLNWKSQMTLEKGIQKYLEWKKK
jgi:UDP-glucose 4-epimerase